MHKHSRSVFSKRFLCRLGWTIILVATVVLFIYLLYPRQGPSETIQFAVHLDPEDNAPTPGKTEARTLGTTTRGAGNTTPRGTERTESRIKATTAQGKEVKEQLNPNERKSIQLNVQWDTDGIVSYDNETGKPQQFLWKWRRDPPPLTDMSQLDDYFGPTFNQSERKTFLETFEFCVRLLKQLKYPPVLFGGSLVGWYRHNQSMIPWDDDVDLTVISVGRPDRFSGMLAKQLAELAQQLAPPGVKYGTWASIDFHLVKLFRIDETSIPVGASNGLQFRWPFIDIIILDAFTYQSSGSPTLHYVWRGESYLYPFEILFPLQEVTFESVQVYAPRNIPAMLQLLYENCMEICISRFSAHRGKKEKPIRSMNCSELFKIDRKYYQYPLPETT